MHVKW